MRVVELEAKKARSESLFEGELDGKEAEVFRVVVGKVQRFGMDV